MRTVFCPVESFLAIGSADCHSHWIVALLCSRYRWERVVGYRWERVVGYRWERVVGYCSCTVMH